MDGPGRGATQWSRQGRLGLPRVEVARPRQGSPRARPRQPTRRCPRLSERARSLRSPSPSQCSPGTERLDAVSTAPRGGPPSSPPCRSRDATRRECLHARDCLRTPAPQRSRSPAVGTSPPKISGGVCSRRPGGSYSPPRRLEHLPTPTATAPSARHAGRARRVALERATVHDSHPGHISVTSPGQEHGLRPRPCSYPPTRNTAPARGWFLSRGS